MEFSILYQGPLKSNGTAKQKQEIHRVFHSQLNVLWQQTPLNSFHEFLQENPPTGKTSIIQKVGTFKFAPLINENLKLAAELNIIYLRPEAHVSLITQSRDIDNRLKTLFDALRMAKVESEIPSGGTPKEDEHPFFCVLEDASLITRVSVKTDRLLQPSPSENHAHLLIGVKIKIVVGTWFKIAIG